MGTNETLNSKNIAAYLENVEAVLRSLQPELNAKIAGECISIKGNLICSGKEGEFDSFEIAVLLPLGFPTVEPSVWETGKRIPKIADRHIYPKSEKCCLCVWQEWLWDTQDADFEAFMTGPLHSYFVSQSIFELTKKWPFGERNHDKKGLDQALMKMLSAIPNAKIDRMLTVLSQFKIKGHTRCPCGSGNRLRNCHFGELISLQQRLPASSWKELRSRRKLYQN